MGFPVGFPLHVQVTESKIILTPIYRSSVFKWLSHLNLNLAPSDTQAQALLTLMILLDCHTSHIFVAETGLWVRKSLTVSVSLKGWNIRSGF